MKSILAKKKYLLAGLPALGATILAAAFLSPRAEPGAAPMMETPAPAPTWKWGLSADYMWRDVDLNEDYKSPFEDFDNGSEFDGPSADDWNVDYDDFDGDLWGFSAFVVPPCFWDIMIDFSYRTGDLDGDFRNHTVDKGFNGEYLDGPYEGKADFDRDEYVVGLTYPIPSIDWLYARLEYFNYQMDGKWDYGDGYTETQDYTLWGITGGAGAHYGIPLGSSGAMFDLNAFAGLVYFDFEHEEVASGGTTDWSDWGFLGRIGGRFSYPIQSQLDVFLGCGYEYLLTDSDDLDMTTQGVFVNLGLKGEF